MLSPSQPPRRKTCTSVRGPAEAARAVRTSSEEGWKPTPTAASPAPRRNTRREMSKLMRSPRLHLGPGQDQARHPRGYAGVAAAAHPPRRVQGRAGEAVAEQL